MGNRFKWKPVKSDFVSFSDSCFLDLEEIVEVGDDAEHTADFTAVDDLNQITESDFIAVDEFHEIKAKKPRKLKEELPVSNSEDWDSYDIHQTLLRNLKVFEKPTLIQQQTLVHAFNHKDIIGCAQTGSGKTLAFGIPILNYIARKAGISNNDANYEQNDTSDFEDIHKVVAIADKTAERQNPVALILAPTRELALQVTSQLKEISAGMRARIVPIVGGMSSQKQLRQLASSPHIIVATPGRLWELIDGDPEFREKVRKIKYLVVDEADRLLEAGNPFLTIYIGHFKHLDNILESLLISESDLRELKRQTFIFSATLVDRKLQDDKRKKQKKDYKELFSKLLEKVQFRDKDPIYINLSTTTLTAEGIMEANIKLVDSKEKDITLYYLISRYTGKTIVFVNSIDCIRRLVPILSLLHPKVFPLHAEMQQKQRIKNLERFRDNENAILIATDVAARGLDIPLVDLVIHYQIPRHADTYIHRAGRTARAGAEGVSVLLSLPSDAQGLKKLMHVLKKDEFDEFPIDRRLIPALNKRFNIAKQIDSIQHKSKKRKNDSDWFKKAAAECDIALSMSEDEDSSEENNTSSHKIKKLKMELNSLLTLPLIPKGQNLKFITHNPELPQICIESKGSNLPTLSQKKATEDLKYIKKQVPFEQKRDSGII